MKLTLGGNLIHHIIRKKISLRMYVIELGKSYVVII